MPILFTATWCTQCQTVHKALEGNPKLKEVYIVDVDTGLGTDLAKSNNIRSLPAYVLDSGEKILGPENIIKQIKGD